MYGEGGGGGALAVLRVTEVLSPVLSRHVQDGDRDHEGAGLVPVNQSEVSIVSADQSEVSIDVVNQSEVSIAVTDLLDQAVMLTLESSLPTSPTVRLVSL